MLNRISITFWWNTKDPSTEYYGLFEGLHKTLERITKDPVKDDEGSLKGLLRISLSQRKTRSQCVLVAELEQSFQDVAVSTLFVLQKSHLAPPRFYFVVELRDRAARQSPAVLGIRKTQQLTTILIRMAFAPLPWRPQGEPPRSNPHSN